MENLSLWLSLFQGLLLPLGLGLCDPTFGEAAILSCSREQARVAPKYEDPIEPYRHSHPKEEIKSFPLTNGSLFSSLLTMNVNGPLHHLPPFNRGKVHGLRMGTAGHEIRDMTMLEHMPPEPHHRGTLSHLFYHPNGHTPLGSIPSHCTESIYSDPLNKVVAIDRSMKIVEDDHIYATLSETFGSLSSISDEFLGDHQRCSSATTDANDDFEYHGPRMNPARSLSHLNTSYHQVEDQQDFVSACNLAIGSRAPPPLPEEERYPPPTPSSSSSDESSPSSSFRSCSSTDICDSLTLESQKDVHYDTETIINPRASPRLGFINEAFESDTLDKRNYFEKIKTESLEDINRAQHECGNLYGIERGMSPSITPADGTLTRKHRSSSLSMNDLDRLETRESDPEEEMMFILPVKSESMLSLYRLYLAEDEDSGCTNLHYSLEVSKSESDLTALHKKGLYNGSDKNAPIQEIYQKKRVPLSAGSRIRRQHKIQRAKVLQTRHRPVLPIYEENMPKHHQQENHSYNSRQHLHERNSTQEVQKTVMNKAKRKNGIITIKDPSVLSVEELFKVLNRASDSEKERTQKDAQKEQFVTSSTFHPATEYKKIFVSEYI